MVFLLILCGQTYPDVAKASTHNICMLYIDPLLLFMSACSQSWSPFVILLPPTKYSCITPCLPNLVELIDMVNSVIIVISQMTLLRWLTYLLRSQILILTVLLFSRYLFLLTLIFLNLALVNFGKMPVIFSTKTNQLYLLYSAARKCCLLHQIKQNLFTENSSKNSDVDDSGISLHVFPSRTNLILHNISVTPRMVKKVITNLDMSKVVSATFVLVCFLSVNESTFQNRKTVFYFTSKALFVLEKIKF